MSAVLAAIVDWLALPLSGATTHAIDPRIAWHARAMVLAWGVLLPLGALAARYLKVLPAQDWPRRLDHRAWWNLHRGFQYLGVALTLAAIWLVWRAGTSPARSAHAILGWGLVLAALIQVASGWLRGTKGGPDDPAGDHYAMTRRRLAFERLHKGLGWMALFVSVVAIALGLALADAPRWMPVALVLWWMALTAAALALQRRGWCADTYQAIWGPSPAHPGNRIQPIGWGVRRGDAIGTARRGNAQNR